MDHEPLLHNSRRNMIARGEQRILDLLKKQGFRLRDHDVRLPAEGRSHGLRFDFLMDLRGRRFVVEIKVASKLADWLFHWMSHSILALQAARRLKGWEPLLAIYADSIDPRILQRFKNQIALYAPDLWWMVCDGHGNVAVHLSGGDEETLGDVPKQKSIPAQRLAPSAVSPSAPTALSLAPPSPVLSFGDLDQWLLKVLFFARLQPEGWGGPRGAVRNLAQLAKLAAVSPPLVYRWASAMQRSGYLSKQAGRVPVLANLDALVAEWRGRYRLSDNQAIRCDPVFGEQVDNAFREDFLGRLRQLPSSAPPCALSAHQACAVYRLKHSDARSIHLYVSGDLAPFMKHLQLVESANPAAPIVLLQPKHRRSALGGVVRNDGIPLCDILQVYLDLYHLPDRGREQADFVHERMLEPLMRAATESAHAI